VTLRLLFLDELRGFYRSKVMLFLWVGMPVFAMSIYLWSPNTEDEIPLSTLVALLVSSLSGTLAAIMVVVGIIHERERHVFDLFVIRPIRRGDLLVARFLAVYLCVVVAAAVAFAFGLTVDHFFNDTEPSVILERVSESLALSLASLAISAAAGILIGIVSPSILVGAILVIYLGNQIAGGVSALSALVIQDNVVTLAMGALVATVLMAISVLVFERKQL
jgi:ABC-type transport system involved in multi-copper enzyme maturation permease subunit